MPGNPKRRAELEAAGAWPPPAGMTAREAYELLQSGSKAQQAAQASAKVQEARTKLVDERRRAQTDLYWLATEVLGYRDLIERVHRPVCEMFVLKDPDLPLMEQPGLRQRLILDPRGCFKTTIDLADVIQWLLCFPNVRILLMTGARELAKRMVHELKSHFTSNERMRELFPEYCPEEGKDFGREDGFTTSARTLARLREPSVSISTIESVKAGSHVEVIKLDDVVDELNSSTPEQIEKVVRAFHYTTPILEPNGYRDVIGTRYSPNDL